MKQALYLPARSRALLTARRSAVGWRFIVALLLLLGSLRGQAQTRLFWVQSSGTAADDRLSTANLDGSNRMDLASGNSASTFYNPNSLAVDVANNIAYVGDAAITGSTGISRFNATTGAFLGTIIAGSATVGFNGIQVVGSRIYWVQSSGTASSDQLCSANLDGSGLTVLASGNSASTFYNPNSLAVDVANNIAYVGDAAITGSTGISRFNATTGAFLGTIVAGSATVSFNGIQVVGSRIYWVQSSGTASSDQLCSANLDGSGLTVLASGNSASTFYNPNSLAVDVANNIAYVGDAAITGSTGISRFNATTGAFLGTIIAGSATVGFNALATNAHAAVAPTVTTGAVSNLTTTSATVSGSLTSDGNANTTYGIVYVPGTSTPTTSNSVATVSTTSPSTFPASFAANLTGLAANTTYTAAAYATNSAGTDYGSNVTFKTAAPTITLSPTTLTAGTVGMAYSQTLTASGGTAPYSLAITAGALPAGLTLASTGTLAGTPTAGGTFTFTVRATDASASPGPYSGTQNYSLTIGAPTITVAPATLPNGAMNTAYSQSITASGGTAPYTYALTAGALPAGLTVASNGTLSGTPTAAGSFTFTVTATDASTGSGPYSGSRSYSVVIGAPTITLTPATLPAGAIAVAYSQTVSASGGTAPYTYVITAGALPAGLTLSSGGTLSGTPTSGGSFSFTITAIDASTGSGAPYSGARAYTLSIGVPTITVGPATLPGGMAAAAYSTAITASGGTAPYTFAVTAGALPAGLNLASNGILSGTPTTSGTFNFTITATDASTGSGPYSGSRTYSLTIAPPAALAITPVTVPNGTVAVAYSQAITASGGTAPYTYAITAGALPAGLSLTAGGVLAGTPTAGGSFTFTVTATDAATGTASTGARSYTLTIVAPTIAVAPTTLPNGAVGAAYSQTIMASGGTAPYTYAITAGALPAGLNLTSGGVLSGAPTASGTFTFTVRATDSSTGSGPYSGARAYTLATAAPTVVVNPTTLPAGTVASAYNQPVTASGGTAPYTFTITAGALPTGLTLASNGTLSGTPTASGSFTFTITATDASTGTGPYTGARSYTVSIATPASVTWTGTISPDWFTAGNWNPNVVPSASTSATIPASAVFQPAINAGTATTLNLTLNSGATLTMNGGTLDVRGNLTSNGSFTPSGGTVVLGTTFQSNGPNIFGSSRVRFWNLTVNVNGVQLSTSAGASVRRLLTLNGAFVTQGNDFVLESDATGTAMVVNSNSAGFVFGSATVQRYIDASGNTGTSGYRHYSSPVGSATVNSLSTSSYGGSFTAQVNTAYNMADPNLLTLATYPNVFSYDESKIVTSPAMSFSDFDKGYQSPASMGSPLTVGRGYAVQIGNNEKVQFTGPLNNNTQTINSLTYAASGTAGSASAGWALVGNPYPAPLDWRTVGNTSGSSLNGVDGAAYVFQSTSAYSGRYTSFTNDVGAGTGLIASGQGFFVRTSTPGTTGSITLNNSNRVTSYASPAFQRTTAETRPLLRLSLGLGSQPATVATAQDETFVYFETGATAGYDGKFDAYKLANPSGYYLGSVTPGTAPLGLSIDGRAPLAVATTNEIPLWVSLPAGTYSLTATELLNFANLAGGTTVQLRDALLGTLTDLATTPSYSFSVAANAPYAGRFSLVFRTSNVLATLPGTELAQANASLYPNPAASATTLSVTGLSTAVTSLQVEVLDVLGRAVAHYKLPVQNGRAYQSLGTDQLAGTLYLLRLTALDAQGQVQGTLPNQRLTLTR